MGYWSRNQCVAPALVPASESRRLGARLEDKILQDLEVRMEISDMMGITEDRPIDGRAKWIPQERGTEVAIALPSPHLDSDQLITIYKPIPAPQLNAACGAFPLSKLTISTHFPTISNPSSY
ncbi:hypothetical protein JB92DRAFT_2833929 [Gautieria morchelliformis]|nr:hypothetical protein JB92DRAFT_2833929 [Gautieria morchelliformis]